ncbi:MAG: type II toxin-antitoxin system Phd/YefM family antitoxin [Methylorubrum rhodinum]|uniref:type II toxin-antitoxin system Phd/YefM family antitoxin n=1 Tax=Methylorubrum rhodinum TaxID=29428 RepID=UPI003BB208C9
MSITTLTSRAFQQNANQAQTAAEKGPVFITKRGKPVQVLLSFDEYQRLTGRQRSLVEALSMPGLADIALEIPQAEGRPHPADLS